MSLKSRLESNKKEEEGHPGGNPWASLTSISHRCCILEVAFEWVLSKETIYLPLGCLKCGLIREGRTDALFDVGDLIWGLGFSV